MKLFMTLLLVLCVIAIVIIGLRMWGGIRSKGDSKVLSELKAAAESGISMNEFLSKASQNDYVITKLETSDTIQFKVGIDDKWDQFTPLDEKAIHQLSQLENGKIELRRRHGGYFLRIEVSDGKMTSATATAPPEQ